MGINRLGETYYQIDKPNTPTSWLIGNVGTWQRLTVSFEVGAFIEFSTSNTLFMEEPNRFTLTNGSKWNEQGFRVGATFVVGWESVEISTGTVTQYSITGQIASIQDNVMISNNSTLGTGAQQSNIYPVQLADVKIYNVFIAANIVSESINFNYGHILNSQFENAPLNSIIDGTISSFVVEGVQNMSVGDTLQFTPIAPQSGMSIALVLLTYRDFKPINSYVPGFLKREYDIDLFFMPCITFDDSSGFNPLESPDAYRATECITDNYEITVSPEQNNPNITIKSLPSLSAKQGNTGWFNENYNGLADDLIVSSVEYRTPTGALRPELDYQSNTLFKAVIEGVQNISGLTRCMYGFQWIPSEQEDYKNLSTPFHQNTKMNTGGAIGAFADVFPVTNVTDTLLRQGYSSDGASMDVKNVRFSQTGANQITFECEFVPSAAFAAFMAALDISERNYIIWVSLGDSSLPTNETDRVSKLLDSNQLNEYIEPIGAYEGLTIEFLNHVQDENSTESPCDNSFKIEDGLLARVLFTLNENEPLPSGFQYGVALQRDSDGLFFELESTPIDLTGYPNVQSYNYSTTRGFKLPVGNNKNFVKLEHYALLDTAPLVGVRGLYGFKLRWEDWLSIGAVPSAVRDDFFNNALGSNGLSNDWYRYLLGNGWSLQFYTYIDTTANARTVRYVNTRPIAFEDYDQNTNISTAITYRRESNNDALTAGVDPVSGLPLGVILRGERTKIEILYTRATGTWASTNDTFAITTIEIRNGAGSPEYRELTTEYPPESDNPLESNTTTLELTLVSPTKLLATCYVNPNKLLDAAEYKITGRIGCK